MKNKWKVLHTFNLWISDILFLTKNKGILGIPHDVNMLVISILYQVSVINFL